MQDWLAILVPPAASLPPPSRLVQRHRMPWHRWRLAQCISCTPPTWHWASFVCEWARRDDVPPARDRVRRCERRPPARWHGCRLVQFRHGHGRSRRRRAVVAASQPRRTRRLAFVCRLAAVHDAHVRRPAPATELLHLGVRRPTDRRGRGRAHQARHAVDAPAKAQARPRHRIAVHGAALLCLPRRVHHQPRRRADTSLHDPRRRRCAFHRHQEPARLLSALATHLPGKPERCHLVCI